MSNPIGVLVDRRVLHRAIKGRETYEKIPLYREIASEEGIDLILFGVEDIHTRRRKVTGFVPTATGWRKMTRTLPDVIHKRVLYRSSAPIKKLLRLSRQGTIFVNPVRIQNKRRMYELLSQSQGVAPHIPATHQYRWHRLFSMLEQGMEAILKPVVGSVGQGIYKVSPLDQNRVRIIGRTSRLLNYRELRMFLRAKARSRRYLLQRCIDLAKYKDRPFDLRVPVQRNEMGRWTVPGAVAKVAVGHPFLTNVAQGGVTMPGETALQAAFSKSDALEAQEQVEMLGVSVAKRIAEEHPHAADLGLDIGVDSDGYPWLIEVNTRDQRITFEKAGMDETFRKLYRNPILYCAALAAR